MTFLGTQPIIFSYRDFKQDRPCYIPASWSGHFFHRGLNGFVNVILFLDVLFVEWMLLDRQGCWVLWNYCVSLSASIVFPMGSGTQYRSWLQGLMWARLAQTCYVAEDDINFLILLPVLTEQHQPLSCSHPTEAEFQLNEWSNCPEADLNTRWVDLKR